VQFWRMQLHPGNADQATRYAVQCLATGVVGFDYGEDPGDLVALNGSRKSHNINPHEIEFASENLIGDKVLVLVHHHPFALATIASDYYYLRAKTLAEREELFGVWCNHIRRVRDIRYYSDWVKDPNNWESFHKCPTIQKLVDPQSASYKPIQRWLEQTESK
jgi:hypothetical protein